MRERDAFWLFVFEQRFEAIHFSVKFYDEIKQYGIGLACFTSCFCQFEPLSYGIVVTLTQAVVFALELFGTEIGFSEFQLDRGWNEADIFQRFTHAKLLSSTIRMKKIMPR